VSERPFTVIGHRGAAALAPENTLAGLRKAAELGVRWVEVDVQLTADGVPILIHDFTLERTTDGRGRVNQASLAKIERLDAGAWFGPQYAGERVPTLEGAIRAMAELGLGANFEIKAGPARAARTGRIAARTIADHWPPHLPAPVISSFSVRALAAARSAAPGVPRALLLRRIAPGWRRKARALGCEAIHCAHKTLTKGRAARIQAAGYPLRCYTVNERARARTLKSWGVAAIFTDRPDIVVEFEGSL
jgi:glycerophosphoryl diester phosphodiesterase